MVGCVRTIGSLSLVAVVVLQGCSSSSHATNSTGGSTQAGGDAGTSGASGSNSSGGDPGAGGAGGANGGDTSAGGASGGNMSAGGASGGTAGSGSGGASGSGGTVVLPEYDYVLTSPWLVPPSGSAAVRALNPQTGQEEFTRSIVNPNDVEAQPLGFAALPDGTFRVLWGSRIIQLDADLNELATILPGVGGVDYAVLPDGKRALLGYGPPATLTLLLADDTIDLTAAVKTIPGGAVAYSALADSARKFAAGFGGAEVLVLTAENEPTALTHTIDVSTAASENFVGTDYHIAADGSVRIAWMAYTPQPPAPSWASRVCWYASEDELGTMPEAEGWEPGTCWRDPTTGARTILYTTFRR